jgi:hypothetical protein
MQAKGDGIIGVMTHSTLIFLGGCSSIDHVPKGHEAEDAPPATL